MLTNIKYTNTPNYLDIRSHTKRLHLGPFQVLINVLDSFKVTQFWISVGKLFHILQPIYLKQLLSAQVLHLGCCTGLGFLGVYSVFIVVTMFCRNVGFKIFIHL